MYRTQIDTANLIAFAAALMMILVLGIVSDLVIAQTSAGERASFARQTFGNYGLANAHRVQVTPSQYASR